MDANKLAWELRSQITTATGGSTFSKPIFQMTLRLCTATTAMEFFPISRITLAWGAMFFDFDNDGWPDLILANGHVYPEVDKYDLGSTYKEQRLLYHNNGNGTFTDVSADAGPGITASSSARGLAVGDLWN